MKKVAIIMEATVIYLWFPRRVINLTSMEYRMKYTFIRRTELLVEAKEFSSSAEENGFGVIIAAPEWRRIWRELLLPIQRFLL